MFLFLEVKRSEPEIFIKTIQYQFVETNITPFMELSSQRYNFFGHLKGARAKNIARKPIREESYVFLGAYIPVEAYCSSMYVL